MFAWRREYGLYDHAVFGMYSLCGPINDAAVLGLVLATYFKARCQGPPRRLRKCYGDRAQLAFHHNA